MKQGNGDKITDNGGQALVLVAVVLPLLFAYFLYVAGTGNIIKEKIHLQNVADSASVAAVTWQARGLNLLVATNNAIEACYIIIASLIPAVLAAQANGDFSTALRLIGLIEKAWKTAWDISELQKKIARIPWSAVAFCQAEYIMLKNGCMGAAVPVPALADSSDPDHALGILSHKATLSEIVPFLEEEDNKEKGKIDENAKTLMIPEYLDMTVKKVNWHQKWKQRAVYDKESGSYTEVLRPPEKVGKFYGPEIVTEKNKSGYPLYPEEYRTRRYYPDDERGEIIGWRPEKRNVPYEWPDVDPPVSNWYLRAPQIGSDVKIIWPKEWEHIEEGFKWGYSRHDSYWCYKWEPLYKDEIYSALDEIRDMISSFSQFVASYVPMPWIRDKDIKYDETCVVVTWKKAEGIRIWKYIKNVFKIDPPTAYAVSQARVFRRTRKAGRETIKPVSNSAWDMILSLPCYEAGIEKVNTERFADMGLDFIRTRVFQDFESDKTGTGREAYDFISENVIKKYIRSIDILH